MILWREMKDDTPERPAGMFLPGERLSLRQESARNCADLEVTVRVAGRHHVKVAADAGAVPGWLEPGDTARLRRVNLVCGLPVLGRVARREEGRGGLLVIGIEDGQLARNRRHYARVGVVLPCTVFTLTGLHVAARTINVSGGGLYLHVEGGLGLRPNERVLVCVDEADSRRIPAAFTARVVRVENQPPPRVGVAVEFLDLDARSRDSMCRFVTLTEIRERKLHGGF
jgi:hypothetical protein